MAQDVHRRRVLRAVAVLSLLFVFGALPTVLAEDVEPWRVLLPLVAVVAAAVAAVVLTDRGAVGLGFGLLSIVILATVFDAHVLLTLGLTAPVHVTGLVILASAMLPWRRLIAFGVSAAGAVLAMRFARGDDGHWFDTTFDLVGAPLLATVLLAVDRWRVDRDEALLRNALREKARATAAAGRAAEEARLASLVKSEFLARVSHELRTPINAILGYTELVQEADDTLSGQTRADLGRVQLASRNLLALVDDVLDLSRVEAGRVASVPEVVTTVALVEWRPPGFSSSGTGTGSSWRPSPERWSWTRASCARCS